MKNKNFLRTLCMLCLLVVSFATNLSAQRAWQLVTSVSDLAVGDQVVIAAKDSAYAISTTQNNNNRSATAVTIENGQMQITNAVQVFTLEAGAVEGSFAFGTGEGYLGAVSNSSNNMRTIDTIGTNSSFAITISADGVTKIIAQGNYSRKDIRYNYNNGNRLFSCYATNSTQKNVAIYKIPAVESNVAIPTFAPAAGTYYAPQTITLACATEGASIYYTLDGSMPDTVSTLYTEPFTVSATTTVKAIAVLNGEYSALAMANYSLPVSVNNIAELRQQTTGNTLYRLNGNAFVTLANANRNAKYIQDSTAGILIDDADAIISGTYNTGDEITGLVGTLSLYSGMLEFIPAIDIPAAVSTDNVIEPLDIELTEMNDHIAELVRITNVYITHATLDTFAPATHYALNSNTRYDLYTRFADLDYIGTQLPTAPQNVVGVVLHSGNYHSIIPRSLADFTINTDVCSTVPTVDSCRFESNSYSELKVISSIQTAGEGCNLTEYGFVYSTTNASPVLEDSINGVNVVVVGDIIAAATNFNMNIDEHVADSIYVRAYAKNDVGTAYGDVLVAYFAEPETYTITYSVNGATDRIAATEFVEGSDSIQLPTVGGCGDWTFLGWSTKEIAQSAAPYAPETIATLIPTENDTLYAVFTKFDGEVGDGSYAKVTSEEDLVGTYLIVYEKPATDTVKIFTGVDAGHNNVIAQTTNGVIPAAVEGQAEVFIAPMEGGYSIQVLNGANAHKYIYGTSGSNALNFNNAPQLNTITFGVDTANVETITITCNTSILRFNDNSGSNNDRFRYYKASSTTFPLATLYKKSGGNDVYTTNFQVDTNFIFASICDGDVYTENGFNATEAGTYVNVINEESTACSQVYKLTLDVVVPMNGRQDTITECSSYTWEVNNVTYYTSGVYEEKILTDAGCDSIINTLVLTINNGENITVDQLDTCLQANEVYTWAWRGESVDCDHSDTYILYALNENECYDTAVRVININRIQYTSIEATICELEVYNENGFNVSEEGVYVDTLQTVAGCDSIVTLTLHVGAARVTNVEDEICLGNGYNGYNFSIAAEELTEAGVYNFSDTLVRLGGCDSITNLTLTVKATSSSDIYDTACVSYTWDLNGQVYTASTEDFVTLTNAANCDSIVTLHLVINQPVATTIEATACETYAWNDSVYTESGEYTQTFTADNGCDSVVTLSLTINQPVENAIEESACETYTWNDSVYTESGEYTMTFTAANGCDSVVTLSLTINQPVENTIEESACETYTWNDSIYTESGEYTMTFTAANGCDSVVTLVLTIDEMPVVEITGDTLIQAGESATLIATENDDWFYTWNTEDITSTIVVEPEETTEYTVTVENGACVATATITVTVSVGIQDNSLMSARIFPNPADEYCTIEVANMQTINVFNMNGQKVAAYMVGDVNNYRLETATFVPGTYFVQVITVDNKVSTAKFVVKH